jgi:hypothetical protein
MRALLMALIKYKKWRNENSEELSREEQSVGEDR